MARKIDLSGAKEFLFKHGEKVALGTCAAIVVIFGVLGMLRAFGASTADGTNKTWTEAFKNYFQTIDAATRAAQEQKVDGAILDPKRYYWDPVTSTYRPTPYSSIPEKEDKGRGNPKALSIRSGKEFIQVKYQAGVTFKHNVDREERKVTGLIDLAAPDAPPPTKGGAPSTLPPFEHVGQPTRMVLVTGVFPMKEQVELFRRAFKMADQEKMFASPEKEDLPHVLGIDVKRFEVGPNGDLIADSEIHIVQFDPKDRKLKINPALEKFLREAIYDENVPMAMEPYLWEGLAMPMPKLGNLRYPRFNFDGIEVAWVDDVMDKKAPNGKPVTNPTSGGVQFSKGFKKNPNPVNPNPPVGAAALKPKAISETELKKADPALAARLFGNRDSDFNIYHVLGLRNTDSKPTTGKKLPPNAPAAAQPSGGKYFDAWTVDPPKPDPNSTQQPPPYPAWERDALVRFIDVDVVPGKTYRYAVQVRIANPNFGKKDKVSYAGLAEAAELPSAGWVYTPNDVFIPTEHYLYAVDQTLVDDLAVGTLSKKAVLLSDSLMKQIKESTPFQVHKWAEKGGDQGAYVIGDWAILERQLVRRGEHIGLMGLVAVPVWNALKEAFEVPKTRDTKAKPAVDRTGIFIELTPSSEAPVLVDFVGGKRARSGNILDEETAVEALIMMPNGKLRVLNSRDAAEGNPVAHDRQERVLGARQRVTDAQRNGASNSATKKGPG